MSLLTPSWPSFAFPLSLVLKGTLCLALAAAGVTILLLAAKALANVVDKAAIYWFITGRFTPPALKAKVDAISENPFLSFLILKTYHHRRTRRDFRDFRGSPLASDSKWCRTQNQWEKSEKKMMK